MNNLQRQENRKAGELKSLQSDLQNTPIGVSNYARVRHAVLETRIQQLLKQSGHEKKHTLNKSQIRKKTFGKLRVAYIKNQMKLIAVNLTIQEVNKPEMIGPEKVQLRSLKRKRLGLLERKSKLKARLDLFIEEKKGVKNGNSKVQSK